MSERKLEHCCECDCPTGRAGRSDDSLYFGDFGPFCEDCYDAWPDKINEEISQLRAQLAEAQKVEPVGTVHGTGVKWVRGQAPEQDAPLYTSPPPQEVLVRLDDVRQAMAGVTQCRFYTDQGWVEELNGEEFFERVLKPLGKAAQGEG